MADIKASRIGLRLPAELRDRVEAYRQRQARLMPGVNLTLSDSARMLILKGLETEEGGNEHGEN